MRVFGLGDLGDWDHFYFEVMGRLRVGRGVKGFGNGVEGVEGACVSTCADGLAGGAGGRVGAVEALRVFFVCH